MIPDPFGAVVPNRLAGRAGRGAIDPDAHDPIVADVGRGGDDGDVDPGPLEPVAGQEIPRGTAPVDRAGSIRSSGSSGIRHSHVSVADRDVAVGVGDGPVGWASKVVFPRVDERAAAVLDASLPACRVTVRRRRHRAGGTSVHPRANRDRLIVRVHVPGAVALAMRWVGPSYVSWVGIGICRAVCAT